MGAKPSSFNKKICWRRNCSVLWVAQCQYEESKNNALGHHSWLSSCKMSNHNYMPRNWSVCLYKSYLSMSLFDLMMYFCWLLQCVRHRKIFVPIRLEKNIMLLSHYTEFSPKSILISLLSIHCSGMQSKALRYVRSGKRSLPCIENTNCPFPSNYYRHLHAMYWTNAQYFFLSTNDLPKYILFVHLCKKKVKQINHKENQPRTDVSLLTNNEGCGIQTLFSGFISPISRAGKFIIVNQRKTRDK